MMNRLEMMTSNLEQVVDRAVDAEGMVNLTGGRGGKPLYRVFM